MDNNSNNSWSTKNKIICDQIGMPQNKLEEQRPSTKETIKKLTERHFKERVADEGKEKSKVQHMLAGKTQDWQPGRRASYMNKLSRNQLSTRFKAR